MTADDRSHLDWLFEFYSTRPTTRVACPDARVALVLDPARLAATRADAATAPRAPGFTFSGRDGRIPRWTRGEEKLALDPDLDVAFHVRGHAIAVVGETTRGAARVALMRVVRELHERWLAAHGFALLHAAALAVGDRIVLIAGPRQSGKSTLLTYLLAHGGTAFVSNDRTAVDAGGRVVGVPTVISIRAGTLKRVMGLPPIPWSAAFLHRRRITELEGDAVDPASERRSPPSFSPAQYRTWLGAAAARAGRAAAIVFPDTSGTAPGPVLEPISASETRARLAEALIRADDNGLLADAASAPVAPPNIVLPAYRCRLGGYPVADARAFLARIG